MTRKYLLFIKYLLRSPISLGGLHLIIIEGIGYNEKIMGFERFSRHFGNGNDRLGLRLRIQWGFDFPGNSLS
jgi:hypothetical protein